MQPILPMIDTATFIGSEKLNDWGLPEQGDSKEVDCQIRYNSEKNQVVGSNGEEVVYTADIYVSYDEQVDYDTTIKFTDAGGKVVEKSPISIQHKRSFWGEPMIKQVVV